MNDLENAKRTLICPPPRTNECPYNDLQSADKEDFTNKMSVGCPSNNGGLNADNQHFIPLKSTCPDGHYPKYYHSRDKTTYIKVISESSTLQYSTQVPAANRREIPSQHGSKALLAQRLESMVPCSEEAYNKHLKFLNR